MPRRNYDSPAPEPCGTIALPRAHASAGQSALDITSHIRSSASHSDMSVSEDDCQSRMSLRFTGIILLSVASLCGCAVRGNVELLEARLREQETAMREMQSELSRANAELASARREVESLHAELNSSGGNVLLPEQVHSLAQLTSVEIDKFRSGGLESDGKPGDDALNAVLIPRDATGDAIKVPASIELSLFDLADSDRSAPIGRWTFDANDALAHWHRGFMGSGYQFRLPWQTIPRHEQLVLHAQLKTADGREFNVSQTINVQPPESAGNLAGNSPSTNSSADASAGRARVGQAPSRGGTSADPAVRFPLNLTDETADAGRPSASASSARTLEEYLRAQDDRDTAVLQTSGTAPPLSDDARFSVTSKGKNRVLTPRTSSIADNRNTRTIRSGPPRSVAEPVDPRNVTVPAAGPRQPAPFPEDADLSATTKSGAVN